MHGSLRAMGCSRRGFLAQLSTTAAGGLLHQVPGQLRWSLPPGRGLGHSVTAASLLPPLDDVALRALALAAIDGARRAGATYADVRASAGVVLQVNSTWSAEARVPLVPWMYGPSLRFGTGLGVRALVDGAWGFLGDEATTPEAAAAAGRAAAGFAKGNRRPGEPRIALAPLAAGVTGTWSTPIELDPFTVPIGEQGELQLEAMVQAMRVPGANSADVQFGWWHRVQVFASTEDVLLVQRCRHARTSATAGARFPTSRDAWRGGEAIVEGLRQGGVGYEAVVPATLGPQLRAAMERAAERARVLPPQPVPAEVGRYDLVLSARAVAGQLALTLGGALDLERALGYRANAEGTSFLAPPLDMLGAYQAASPLVTVRADRTTPDGTATVKWDDEGTPTTTYPLLEQGRVVGYHTSRETAPELASWFARQGAPVRATGSVRGGGMLPPIVRLPNLTLEPARTDVTVDELVGDVKRGFYVTTAGGAGDQQLLSNQFGVWPSSVYAIRNGRLGPPVTDFAVQYLTPTFWRSLDALGGVATARATVLPTDGRAEADDPLHFPFSTVRAVPARFRQVNVLNTGRTA